jgi:hypothetical protein
VTAKTHSNPAQQAMADTEAHRVGGLISPVRPLAPYELTRAAAIKLRLKGETVPTGGVAGKRRWNAPGAGLHLAAPLAGRLPCTRRKHSASQARRLNGKGK